MKTDYSKLYCILKKRKISMSKFRKEAGLIKTDIEKIESGNSLSIKAMKNICEYLNCDVPAFSSFDI